MFTLLFCGLVLQLSQTDGYGPWSVRYDVSTADPWIQKEIIDIHNYYRRGVQPPASDMLLMNYSTAIAAVAEAWINNCILAHGPPSSRMLNGYQLGENLFYSSSIMSWTEVITAWHSEVENFRYPSISTNGKTIGHYTQLVWNTSYKVGCAMVKCNWTYFYSCLYFRAGNFQGVRPYKVGRPCASCRNNCKNNLCTNPCPYLNGFSNCPRMSQTYGCHYPGIREHCFASCNCTNQIIPVG